MAELNTNVAYPYTRSDRAKDKIMSEVMISQIVKYSFPGDIQIGWVDDNHTKLVMNGYYFEPSITLQNEKYVYCFVEAETKSFPELLNWASMTDTQVDEIDPLECLFILDDAFDGDTIPSPFDTVILKDENGYYYGDHNYVQVVGSKVSDIKSYKFLSAPFYIAQQSDNNLSYKIWIKQDTMNPYVYDESISEWVPLGAVYKI